MTTPVDEAIDAQLVAARETARSAPRRAVRESREAGSHAADERVRRYWWPRIIIAAALAAIVASGATAYVTINVFGARLSSISSAQAARDAGQDAAADELRARAVAASQRGEAANDQLEAKGIAPVTLPKLGEASDAEVLTASIVPIVLAQLADAAPTGVPLAPNAKQVADALASYLAANPVVVNPQDIADQVASYLAANPAQAGPAGPVGPAGPTPTSDQIMSAFRESVAADPSLLCPSGGVYGSANLITTSGTVNAYGCFGTTTTNNPPPDPGSGDQGGDQGGQDDTTPPDTGDPAPPTTTTNPPETTSGGLLGGTP